MKAAGLRLPSEKFALPKPREMPVAEILSIFSDMKTATREWLIDWKKQTGRKIVGCFPMDIPEEIVHAAGMLPVTMWENDEPITAGHAHISPYNCGIVRSVVDDGARDRLDFLDGIVTYETCLQARHMEFLLKKTGHKAHFHRIFLPGVTTGDAARNFLGEILERFRKSMERLAGRQVGEEDLRRSILVYNENRGLLRKLYRLRRRSPALLSASEILAVVHSSMLMLKEDHNRLLRRLLDALERRKPMLAMGPRIILSGSLCEAPKSVFLDLIEEAGMVVVDDDLYVGSRYFVNDAEPGKDPLEALADRYLKRTPPSPTKVDVESDWSDYIVQLASRSRAKGVISLVVKFCPPHLAYYPDIERSVKAAGIRTLMLEMEHEVTSVEQVRTRLQAFRESMERP